MPTRSELIELDVGPEDALAACREALSSSGWEITEEGPGRLHAREEAWRLDCRTSPSQLEIRLLDPGEGHTGVSVEARAPGIGPIPGPGRLLRQIEALRSRLESATGRRPD